MGRFAAVLVATVALSVAAPRAESLTVRDIIELSRAGLGDDVLLALIDVNGGVYAIDPGTLKKLQEAGVSQRVIVALVRSGRERPPVPPPLPPPAPEAEAAAIPPPPPHVVVVEHHEPQVQPVFVPVYVAVPTAGHGHRRPAAAAPAPATSFVPFQSGVAFIQAPAPAPQEPVYWGFGGKRRPDAWSPPPQPVKD